jgi:hypothetical protein
MFDVSHGYSSIQNSQSGPPMAFAREASASHQLTIKAGFQQEAHSSG